MSQENVEIVRGFLNMFLEVDEGLADPQQLTEFAAPDATFDLGTFSAVAERSEMRSAKRSEMRSLDDFLRFRAASIEPYDDWSYVPERIVDAGANRVVVTLYQRGRPHGSDSWVEMHYGIVYVVKEGLIRRGGSTPPPRKPSKRRGAGVRPGSIRARVRVIDGPARPAATAAAGVAQALEDRGHAPGGCDCVQLGPRGITAADDRLGHRDRPLHGYGVGTGWVHD